MKIHAVSPGEAGHSQLAEIVKRTVGDRVDYNSIAVQYNATVVDGVLLIDLPAEVRLGNIVKVLKGRGLIKNQDFNILRPNVDSKGTPIPENLRPVLIKKLSDSEMALKRTT